MSCPATRSSGIRRTLVSGLVLSLGIGALSSHAQESSVLEEVIVTATKRAENVQDIPGAISALSANTIADLKMETIDDAANMVPNVVIMKNSSHTPYVFIRGLGLNDFNAISVGSVGIYQDQVYMNSTAAQLQQMFDLERIEVVRGPQGTLYGRNTTGGVINLISRRPEQENGFEARIGVGRFEQIDVEATANVALTDNVAARFATSIHNRDTIFKNTNGTGDARDIDNWAVRGMLLFTPSDNSELLWSLFGSKVDQRGSGRDKSWISENPDRADVGKPFAEPLTRPGWEEVEVAGTTFTANFDLGGSTLTTVTSFMNSKRDTADDIDSVPQDWLWDMRTSDADQFSQEVRLASIGESNLDWTVGAYYFFEQLKAAVDLRAIELLDIPGFTFLSETEYTQKTISAALFSDLAYQLSENVSLVGGLRWTYEEKDFATKQEGFFWAPLETGQAKKDWNELSGSAGIEYQFNDDTMLYGKYSRGFRAGGFNAGGGVADPNFDPEYVNSYEIGLKSTLADGKVRLNVAAFMNDYDDMQVFALVSPPGTEVPVQYLTNAAKADISGIEVELAWLPTSNLMLQFSGGYLDAEFDKYIDGNDVDRSGNDLVGAPDTTFSGMIRYDIPLSNGGEISLMSDISYRGEFYFDNANTDRYAPDSRTLIGARIRYSSPDDRYAVSLWGRNLGDEEYFARATSFIGLDSISLGDPRTYGVELYFRF